MKNSLISLSVLLITCTLAIIPPINLIISNPPLEYWLWMVLIAGFFGIYLFFIKISWVVRLIALAAFINCYFSVIPYLSFSAYVLVVCCCYLYKLCTLVEDWKIIFKALQALVILNTLVMFMQFIGHDPLLNFGVFHMEHYGILGQHMQMASFITVLSALLISISKFYILIPIIVAIFCHSSWSFLVAGIGISAYWFHHNIKVAGIILLIVSVTFLGFAMAHKKIEENLNTTSGRFGIWKRSIELSNQRPWMGWGIGTYKDVFPPISKLNCLPWRTAHNFIVELIFEVGYPLTGCLLIAFGCLLVALWRANLWVLFSGLVMMLSDAMAHFPDRVLNCVPLIILFFALCRFNLRKATS